MSDSVSTLALKVKSSAAARTLDEFTSKTENLGSVAKSTTAAIASMFAGSKMIAYGKEWLMAASDAQEAAGKFRAVFKSSVDDANKAVSELAKNYNFSTREAMGSISTMADIFQKSGLSIRQSMEFALNINKQAADIEAFTNCTGGLEHVTHALTNAMLGFGMMAQHLGVVIKDEMVQEQMLEDRRNGLIFSTDQAAKMYARYQVILKSSSNATGQVARESGNFANRLRLLRSRVADLKQTLGDSLIAPATVVVGKITDMVNAFNGLSQSTKNAIVWTGVIGTTIGTLGTVIVTAFAAYKTYSAIQATATALTKTNTQAINQETAALEANTVAQAANNATKSAAGGSVGGSAASEQVSGKGKRSKWSELDEIEDEAKKAEARAAASRTKAQLLMKNKHGYSNEALRMSLEEVQEEIRINDLVANEKREAYKKSRVLFKRTDPKYRNIGKNMVNASGKGSIFSKASNAVMAIPGVNLVIKPLKSLSVWFTKFGTSATKIIPVIGRFSGVFGKFIGFAGPVGLVVGAVVGALEVFKNAPAVIEKFTHEWWPMFKDYGFKAVEYIGAGISSAVSAIGSWGKNLVVGGFLGIGQVFKKAFGSDTEATRAYELTKKLELIQKKRQAIQDIEKKRIESEQKLLDNNKAIETSKLSALQENWNNTSDDVLLKNASERKVEKTKNDIKEKEQLQDQTGKEIVSIGGQIDRLKNQIQGIEDKDILEAYKQHGYGYNGDKEAEKIRKSKIAPIEKQIKDLEDKRDELLEITTLNVDALDALYKNWVDESKSLEELKTKVSDSRNEFVKSQDDWKRNREEIERGIAEYNISSSYDHAKATAQKKEALNSELDFRNKEIERASVSKTEAEQLNKELNEQINKFYDEKLTNAINDLQEIAVAKDFDSAENQAKYVDAISRLEKFGNHYENVSYDQENVQRIFNDLHEKRKTALANIENLTNQRDAAAETADQLQSFTQNRDSVLQKIQELQKESDQKEYEYQQNKLKRNEKLAEYAKSLRDTIKDEQFDRLYNKANENQKLLLLSRKLAENDQVIASFTARQKEINALNPEINTLSEKIRTGELTDEKSANDLKLLTEKRDDLEEKLQQDKLDALKEQFTTENQINELAKLVADKRFQDYEKIREKRLEEFGRVGQEMRKPIESQKAIESGSSEAFAIQNRIYNDRTPSVADNTKQTAENTKIMKDRLVEMLKQYSSDLRLFSN